MDYADIFKRALQLTWQTKVIWAFSALSSIAFLPIYLVPQPDYTILTQGPVPEPEALLQQLNTFFILLGVSILLSMLLTPIGRGGALLGLLKTQRGEPLALNGLFKTSFHYYWRLLLLPIGLLLISLGIWVLPLPLLLLGSALLLCVLPLMCLLTPVMSIAMLLASFLVLLALLFIVDEDQRAVAALKSSWQLLRTHTRDLVLAMILFPGLNIVLGIGFSTIRNTLVASMSAALALLVSNAQLAATIQLVVNGFASLVFVALLAIASVFYYALWTLTYLELSNRPPAVTPVAA